MKTFKQYLKEDDHGFDKKAIMKIVGFYTGKPDIPAKIGQYIWSSDYGPIYKAVDRNTALKNTWPCGTKEDLKNTKIAKDLLQDETGCKLELEFV